jgi:hypothetical protein
VWPAASSFSFLCLLPSPPFLTHRPTPSAVHDTWPPAADPKKWVYFGGVDSGFSLGASSDILQQVDSVEQLLSRAATLANCAAVTTDGRVVQTGGLRPQSDWRPRHEWGRGVYVRAAVARELRLQQPGVRTPRQQGEVRGAVMLGDGVVSCLWPLLLPL